MLREFCSLGIYRHRLTHISLVKRLRPDIVLTDIELNDGSTGIKAAEELLSLSPRTQIIYVTSYTDKFIQDVFLSRANVCGFLNKPIERSYFKKMVKKAGGKRTYGNSHLRQRNLYRLRKRHHIRGKLQAPHYLSF